MLEMISVYGRKPKKKKKTVRSDVETLNYTRILVGSVLLVIVEPAGPVYIA